MPLVHIRPLQHASLTTGAESLHRLAEKAETACMLNPVAEKGESKLLFEMPPESRSLDKSVETSLNRHSERQHETQGSYRKDEMQRAFLVSAS
mmetsp:Transcript_27199/g.39839  ORF Transcript_27199/g.39839 Transcript_27199/m.39839 type:complete len:93 (-) Transcript_27199:117-395(-)